MCSVLDVSRAGFYKWRKRQINPSAMAKRHKGLLEFLKDVAEDQHGIPGYRKLHRDAIDNGYVCSKNQVQRLLQSIGYRSCRAKSLYTGSKQPSLPVLPNLLNREFNVQELNRVWVSDITQIRCREGWLYCAVVIDLADRSIVGLAIGAINNTDLVLKALHQAWANRKPDGSQLLFHSDQGKQYHNEEVMRWLINRGITPSMSRKGNCWDNACAESFFATLKREWTRRLGLISREEMHVEIRFYIDDYYHPVRRHDSLGGITPNEFRKQLMAA